MTKSKFFLYLCLAFVAGVFLASFLSIPILVIWAIFIFGCILIVLGLTRVRLSENCYSAYSPTTQPYKEPGEESLPKEIDTNMRFFASLRMTKRQFGQFLGSRALPLIFSGFIVLLFVFGVWRFIQKADLVSRGLDGYISRPKTFSGAIISESAQKEKSQELIVEEEKTKNKVLIRTRKYPNYFYGQEISIEGLLEFPENFTEVFDYQAYLAKDDIFYVMNFPAVKVIGEPKPDLHYYLFSIKSAFSKNINSVLPEPHASFLSGLILGERRSISQSLMEDFQTTGTSHIVALSGYNITIVATSIMQFLAWLSMPFRISFWLATVAVVLFTLLTGASASVVRAAIMGILVLVARKEGRLYSVRNALVLAGAVMVFQNPKILRFDTAFQLSFLATLGLVYVSPIFDKYFEKIKQRILWKIQPRFSEEKARPSWKVGPSKRHFLRETLVSTFSAQFMVLPLLIYNFGRLSLISPLTNILVLSAIPTTMFFGFLTGAGGFIFQPLAILFSWVSWLLLAYQIFVIEFFAKIPLASVAIFKIPFVLVLAFYIAIGYWLWWKYKNLIFK